MKKLLLFSIVILASFSLFSQDNLNHDGEKADQASVSQSSSNTISLYVRQNDFSRVAVSASRPVPETVYIGVVVWHAPPGIYDDEHGQDIATFSIVLNPGEMNASEELLVNGMPAYIIGGVYSAHAYGAGNTGIKYVIN